MARQVNLPFKFWTFALQEAMRIANCTITTAHPNKTPYEQITGSPPLYCMLAGPPWGSLVAVTISGERGPLKQGFQLAAIVGRASGVQQYVVITQGSDRPIVREQVTPIAQPDRRRTVGEWRKIQAVFDDDGWLVSCHSGTKTKFTLQAVVERLNEVTAGPSPGGIEEVEHILGTVDAEGNIREYTRTRQSARVVETAALREKNAVQTGHQLAALERDAGAAAQVEQAGAGNDRVGASRGRGGVAGGGPGRGGGASSRDASSSADVMSGRDRASTSAARVAGGRGSGGVGTRSSTGRSASASASARAGAPAGRGTVSPQARTGAQARPATESLVGRKISKFFPGHGWYEGLVERRLSGNTYSVYYPADSDRT